MIPEGWGSSQLISTCVRVFSHSADAKRLSITPDASTRSDAPASKGI
jgi:hypothetical protein